MDTSIQLDCFNNKHIYKKRKKGEDLYIKRDWRDVSIKYNEYTLVSNSNQFLKYYDLEKCEYLQDIWLH